MRGKRLDVLAIILLVILILGSLHMMSNALQRSEVFEDWFIPLLILTVSGLIILVILTGWSLWQLLRDYRKQVVGSRLNLRLVVMIGVFSLLPVSIVYFYSVQFLAKGIDGWFDVQIDSAMDDALALSQVSLDLHKKELLKLSEGLLDSIEDSSEAAMSLTVGDLRERSKAVEVSLYSLQGDLIAFNHQNSEVLTPSRPTSHMVQQINSGKNFVTLAPANDGQTVVHILVRDPRERGMYLQAIYLVSDSLNALTTSVRDAYEVYKERAYLRSSIKFSFGLTLSLVLLLGLFAAAWGAFYTSRHMVKPIRDISEGTQAVAAGDYEAQVPNPKIKDELSFLVDSFNQMTRRILQTRNIADESRRELQAQHGYLETILGALSSGVIAFDHYGIIKTANPTAEKILGMKIFFPNGISLEELVKNNTQIKPFVDSISKNIFKKNGSGSFEITLHKDDGRQVLLCRYSNLQINEAEQAGRVLVFDDVTELMRAQKDAAWSEVARRLAHEIKNPLTPIQLAAERMRHKYLDKMDKAEADVLERATKTIVQQVDALKLMVNEFSDFARPCKMDPRPILIDEFFHDVMALYEDPKGNVIFDPGAENVAIEGDAIRLRQVLHNLIKNGQEALPSPDGRVKVATSLLNRNERKLLQISVEDDGNGFDPAIIDQAFEPYVTSKNRGTGLGLAIVKRIIGEHGGSIRADNTSQKGARIIIHLPLRSTEDSELKINNSDWREESET
tara:strand:- start:3766 stop:5961 length:2196 start_codon:yes stop_codon:yes gene_type:complete